MNEEVYATYILKKDSFGRIVSIEEVAAAHSSLKHDSEEFLSHYGKQGMKWGHRKGTQNRGPVRNFVQGKETQSLAARRGKQVASAMLGGPVGLIGYNMIAKPLNEKSATKINKKTQSGAAYVAKAIAIGMLTSPLGTVAYFQSAKNINPKK